MVSSVAQKSDDQLVGSHDKGTRGLPSGIGHQCPVVPRIRNQARSYTKCLADIFILAVTIFAVLSAIGVQLTTGATCAILSGAFMMRCITRLEGVLFRGIYHGLAALGSMLPWEKDESVHSPYDDPDANHARGKVILCYRIGFTLWLIGVTCAVACTFLGSIAVRRPSLIVCAVSLLSSLLAFIIADRVLTRRFRVRLKSFLQETRSHVCINCHYRLNIDLDEGRCPECGTNYSVGALNEYWQRAVSSPKA